MGAVKVQEAEAWDAKDRARIFKAITDKLKGGFDELNHTVRDRLLKVASRGLDKLKLQSKGVTDDVFKTKSNVARSLREEGKLDEACAKLGHRPE